MEAKSADGNQANDLLVEGYTVHGCVDREGKIVRLPEVLYQALDKWDQISTKIDEHRIEYENKPVAGYWLKNVRFVKPLGYQFVGWVEQRETQQINPAPTKN